MHLTIRLSKNRNNNKASLYSDICWKLLSLSFFFSPLRCYGLFTIGGFTGSLYKIISLLMIVVVFIKCLYRDTGYKIYADSIFKIIALMIAYDIFALIYSNRSSLGSFPSYFTSHIIMLFSYIVIQNRRGNIYSLFRSYVLGSIIPAGIGLFQWFSVMSGRGVPEMPLRQFLVSAGKDDLFLYGNYRVVGTLLDPSYYGLYMSSVCILCLGVILLSNNIEELEHHMMDKLILTAISVLSLFCVFISGSVTSLIALASGVAFMTVVNRKHVGRVIKYALYTIVIIVIALLLMNSIFNYDPIEVMRNKLMIQSNSTSYVMFGRMNYFMVALEEFANSPLFGVGFGNLSLTSAHNSFLTILAMLGIVGFSIHIMIFLIPFLNRKYSLIVSPLRSVSLSALFGMSVQLMGYDCLYKMDPTIVIVLLPLIFLQHRSDEND